MVFNEVIFPDMQVNKYTKYIHESISHDIDVRDSRGKMIDYRVISYRKKWQTNYAMSIIKFAYIIFTIEFTKTKQKGQKKYFEKENKKSSHHLHGFVFNLLYKQEDEEPKKISSLLRYTYLFSSARFSYTHPDEFLNNRRYKRDIKHDHHLTK